MNSIFDAFLRSWPFDPWLSTCLVLTAIVYFRGWRVLRRRDASRWPLTGLAAFGGGLAALFLALASPIDPFASFYLLVHMLQHLLLMMIAPALLWLGQPLFPLLRGLPRSVRTVWVAPVYRSSQVRRFFRAIVHPVTAWLLFTGAAWIWHIPPVYEVALRSDGWHFVQHACFFGAAMLFWFPVIRPYPARPRWSPWLLIPYLILADIQNTLLSALFVFSDRPLYRYYVQRPRLGSLMPLEDQAAAGVLMWVPGSLVYLLPLFFIVLRLLRGDKEFGRRSRTTIAIAASTPAFRPLPVVERRRLASPVREFDLVRVPFLGRFLRWRHSRLALQSFVALLAGTVVYDGLRGPSISAMNLAGVLPWIHWRGLLMLAMLIAGNVFCMACPFTLPRVLAGRWLPAGHEWPAWLRSKWLAVGLLAVFFWAYEVCAIWDSPWWTAWIVLAYFAAAFAVDGLFRGGSFCKYVCPIGQFNFIQSLVSPWEVKIRDPVVCASCRSHDCIRGRDEIPGCEMRLFQPHKSSNMDCTFCLDCLHACPHQNVGILAVRPGESLFGDPVRSGIGRFSRRFDLAALAVVLVFSAFINAAGMVGPVVACEERLASAVGSIDPSATIAAVYLAALVALPVLAVRIAARFSRCTQGLEQDWKQNTAQFCWALVPVGFGMWLAHYGFHFITSYAAFVPAVQRFTAGLGATFLGSPKWTCACCVPPARWLLKSQIVSLDLGLLFSLYAGYRIAVPRAQRPTASALKAFAPWAILTVVLFLAGIWIVFQPMQMRGTLPTAV